MRTWNKYYNVDFTVIDKDIKIPMGVKSFAVTDRDVQINGLLTQLRNETMKYVRQGRKYGLFISNSFRVQINSYKEGGICSQKSGLVV